MSDLILNADDVTFQTHVLSGEGTVVVDFWAPWCGPCRAQGPILEAYAKSHEDVTIVKVNVDESPKTAAAYGIRSIPTIAVFQDGTAAVAAMGVQRKPQLDKMIEQARNHAHSHG